MKKYVVLLAICALTINVSAQEKFDNFQVVNNELVWQKVIPTEIDFESLVINIENLMLCDTIIYRDNQVVALVNDFYIDTRENNSSSISIPSYVRDRYVNFHMTIDYKPNKYRVTIKRIYYERNVIDSCLLYKEEDRLEKYALNSKRIVPRNGFKYVGAKGFDVAFTHAFTFPEEEEW